MNKKHQEKINLNELSDDELDEVLKNKANELCDAKIKVEKMKNIAFSFLAPVSAVIASACVFDVQNQLGDFLGSSGVMAICGCLSARSFDKVINQAKEIKKLFSNHEYEQIVEKYNNSKDKDFRFLAQIAEIFNNDPKTQYKLQKEQEEKNTLPSYKEIFTEFNQEEK